MKHIYTINTAKGLIFRRDVTKVTPKTVFYNGSWGENRVHIDKLDSSGTRGGYSTFERAKSALIESIENNIITAQKRLLDYTEALKIAKGQEDNFDNVLTIK